MRIASASITEVTGSIAELSENVKIVLLINRKTYQMDNEKEIRYLTYYQSDSIIDSK